LRTDRQLFVFEQFKELIQLGKNNDTGTAVLGAAVRRVVARNRQVFAPSSGGDMGRLEAIFVLEDANDGGGAFYAEIPIIQEIAPAKGNVVCVAFNHEFDIRLGFEDLGDFAEDFLGADGNIVFATGKKKFIGNVYIHDAFVYFYIDVLVVQVADCAL